VGQAACAVCRPLAFWLSTVGDPAEPNPAEGLAQLADLAAALARDDDRAREAALAAIRRRQDAETVLRSHRALHVLLARELAGLWAACTGAPAPAAAERAQAALGAQAAHDALLAEPALSPFLAPAWDEAEGHRVLREPATGGGGAARSQAFFLLHRHRFGAFFVATVGDYALGQPATVGAAPGRLRLYELGGRLLQLAGLPAGDAGDGPRGTLWLLRAAGLAEAAPDAADGELARTVFWERAFQWPPDPPDAV
jgi:hypothetical protein